MRGTQAGEEGRCGAMGEKGAEGKTPRVGKGFFPETWNLKPGSEVNSHTDGHGRTRTVGECRSGQKSEVREGTEGGGGDGFS
jgi:hypothetical protein